MQATISLVPGFSWMRRFPRGDEFEMLDGVGDVDSRAVEIGFGHRAVEQLAGRADEGAAGEVLLVARLLADEHDASVGRAFAEHGLGRGLPEVAAAAVVDRGGGGLQGGVRVGGDRRGRRQVRGRGAGGGKLGLVDHGVRSGLGGSDKLGNDGCLGKVAPVFLRHLGRHRADLEAGRIEDAAVVGPPVGFEAVVVRDVGLAGARREGEIGTIPVNAAIRGQDGPGHGGEAADEECGVGLDDVVVGLEPGDVLQATLVRNFAEADEGAHLVGVAADALGEAVGAVDVGVGGHLQQMLFAAVGAPDQAVEQGEALGVAVLG